MSSEIGQSSTFATLKKVYRNLFPRKRSLRYHVRTLSNDMTQLKDLLLQDLTYLRAKSHVNPLNAFGKECFSQADEDGIMLEILRRINYLNSGTYVEFGIGDGTENNTLILAALGWRGIWIDGSELVVNISNNENFQYIKKWITLENITDVVQGGIKNIGASTIDVVSLDLDGNDIHFCEKLLVNGIRPKLFVVEYNAKFPPPVEFKIEYDPSHIWQGDDYFGASLTSFTKLFEQFNYRLICCNSHTGSNAFFISNEYSEFFKDVPSDINEIYCAPRYYIYKKFGHTKSARTIELIFKNNHRKI